MPAQIPDFFHGLSNYAQAAFGGWGVTALGVICVCQYVIYLHKLRKSRGEHRNQVDEMSAEMGVIQKDHMITRMENRLLREFVSETDVDRAIRVLLKNLVPDTDSGFAVYVEFHDEETKVGQSRGLSREARKSLVVDAPFQERARGGRPFVLSGEELRNSQIAANLSAADRGRITQLYLVGIETHGQLIGMVISTKLFSAEIEQQQHFDLLQRLTKGIGELRRTSAALELQKNELHRTNDILELRALTDSNFESPVDMIQQFMTALRTKTGSGRAALYISTTVENLGQNAFVRCGSVSNPNSERQLCQAEDAVAAQAHASMEMKLFDRADLLRHGIHSFLSKILAIPLVRKGATVGVICLSREAADDYQEVEIDLAQWSAEYMAGTILNVLQRAHIEQQARTDSLTGMSNRASFDAAIDAEVRAAHEMQESCSLLLLDLDRFKAINDNFGHLVGDHVLRATAQVVNDCLNQTRLNDRAVAARYGGEELAVLLPGMNHEGAGRIAELIRSSVAENKFTFAQESIPVTISIGVATLPKDASDVQQLIAAADGALYFAKQSGRNRVGIAQHTAVV